MLKTLYIRATLIVLLLLAAAVGWGAPYIAQAQTNPAPLFTSPDTNNVSSSTVANAALTLPELSDSGLHYEVMRRYLVDPESTRSLADLLSVANSAWALGLVTTARELWDSILADQTFSGTERNRTLLARAIVELQEGNYEQARQIAETGAAALPASELRAQYWLVIGEALDRLSARSQAENYYQRAVDESSDESRNEALLLLGNCQQELGLVTKARYSYAGVGSRSRFASKALKRLLAIDLSQRSYEGVLTWINEGTANHSIDFKDPWISFAHISALVALNRLDDAEEQLATLRKNHTESNIWYTLGLAAYESKALQQRDGHARARLAPADVASEQTHSQKISSGTTVNNVSLSSKTAQLLERPLKDTTSREVSR